MAQVTFLYKGRLRFVGSECWFDPDGIVNGCKMPMLGPHHIITLPHDLERAGSNRLDLDGQRVQITLEFIDEEWEDDD